MPVHAVKFEAAPAVHLGYQAAHFRAACLGEPDAANADGVADAGFAPLPSESRCLCLPSSHPF